MRKNLFLIASCMMLLFAAGCTEEADELQPANPQKPNTETTITGNQSKPSWAVPEDYDMTSSMTTIVKVDLSFTYPDQVAALKEKVLNEGDVLAAFDGNTCIGVAELTDNLFFLYITSPASEDNQVAIRYYSATLKNIFVAQETITFSNDAHIGSVSEPFAPKFVVAK